MDVLHNRQCEVKYTEVFLQEHRSETFTPFFYPFAILFIPFFIRFQSFCVPILFLSFLLLFRLNFRLRTQTILDRATNQQKERGKRQFIERKIYIYIIIYISLILYVFNNSICINLYVYYCTIHMYVYCIYICICTWAKTIRYCIRLL